MRFLSEIRPGQTVIPRLRTRFLVANRLPGPSKLLVGIVLVLVSVALIPSFALGQRARLVDATIWEDSLFVQFERSGILEHLKLPLPPPPLEEVHELPDEEDGEEIRSDSIRFEFTSNVSRDRYEVLVFASERTVYSNLATGLEVDLPSDLIRASAYFDEWFYGHSPQTSTGFSLNPSARTVGIFLDHTFSFLVVALSIILLAGVLVGRSVWHSRMEKRELLASRKRLFEARENERAEVASDLHDGPVQKLQLLQGRLAGGRGAQTTNEADASQVAQEVTRQLRELCSELRPPILHHFGFVAAAKSVVGEFREAHQECIVHSNLDGDFPSIDAEMGALLYKALTESLANIAKHAQAQNVWVELTISEYHIVLEVRDDGIGFARAPNFAELEREGHLGLSFLSQRAESMDVTLTIESTRGVGTRVLLARDREPANRWTTKLIQSFRS